MWGALLGAGAGIMDGDWLQDRSWPNVYATPRAWTQEYQLGPVGNVAYVIPK